MRILQELDRARYVHYQPDESGLVVAWYGGTGFEVMTPDGVSVNHFTQMEIPDPWEVPAIIDQWLSEQWAQEEDY